MAERGAERSEADCAALNQHEDLSGPAEVARRRRNDGTGSDIDLFALTEGAADILFANEIH